MVSLRENVLILLCFYLLDPVHVAQEVHVSVVLAQHPDLDQSLDLDHVVRKLNIDILFIFHSIWKAVATKVKNLPNHLPVLVILG